MSFDLARFKAKRPQDRQSTDPLGSQLVEARCLAYELARAIGPNLEDEIRAFYARKADSNAASIFIGTAIVEPGDPIPLATKDMRRTNEGRKERRRGSVPGALPFEQAPSRIPDLLTLASDLAIADHMHCSVNFVFADVALPVSSVLATGHPIMDSHEVRRPAEEGSGMDPEELLSRIGRIIALAGDEGVRLLVLTEGAVTGIEQQVYEQWLDRGDDGPQFLVAGSAWSGRDPETENCSRFHSLVDEGMPRTGTVQYKMDPVRTNRPPLFAKDGRESSEEPGDDDPAVTIYPLTGGVKLTIAICRDVLDPLRLPALGGP